MLYSHELACRSPGIVDTAFWDTTPGDVKNDIFEETRKKLLVGHIGSPDEVAEAYIFAMKVYLACHLLETVY